MIQADELAGIRSLIAGWRSKAESLAIASIESQSMDNFVLALRQNEKLETLLSRADDLETVLSDLLGEEFDE